MAALPAFTHHELLSLAEPFARRGLRVDLAASDREARRLVFQARIHAADAQGPALSEVLTLEHPAAGRFTLSRAVRAAAFLWPTSTGAEQGVTEAQALQAVLSAEGDDPAVLLEQIEAVPCARQLLVGPGYVAALQQRLPAARSGAAQAADRPAERAAPGGASDPVQPVLREARAHVVGLVVRMKVSGVSGYPAEIELQRPEGQAMTLPDDLLEVLGRPWDRLTALDRGWIGSVRLKGAEPRRSREAEACLHRLLEHLALTLSEPPARFHERHRRARWAVAMRGTLPIGVGAGLVGAALWFQHQAPPGHQSVLALLANIAPPLLMGALFLRREMPRISLPRVPRRPRPQAWQPRPQETP